MVASPLLWGSNQNRGKEITFRCLFATEDIQINHMVQKVLNIGRYLFLVLITLFASAVMWWVSRPNLEDASLGNDSGTAPLPTIAMPKSLVFAKEAEPVMSEVKIRYSGRVQAWETYSLGFEIGGRVASLGENEEGLELDDGDRVSKGQVLARLDDRVLRARVAEAVAQLELAGSDLERSRRIRESTPGAYSEADYQNDLTQFALRKAAQEIANKNLEDAVLTSPVDGIIYRRMVESGESVNPHTIIFDIVEDDRLRLVLNVPESRIRELELRRREVAEARLDPNASEDDKLFKAYVKLEGTDVRGRQWPAILAEVHHISAMADEATGLFEIEVLIPNEEGLLRPGMVATAELVTDRILAYQIPEPSVLFRSGKTYLFTLDPAMAEKKIMFWDVGQGEIWKSRRVEVHDWIDQGEVLLLPATSYQFDHIVTRGHQRLRNGQLVRIASSSQVDLEEEFISNNTLPADAARK